MPSSKKKFCAHRFAGYDTMPPHSDICQVAPYDRLGLNDVLAVEDDILRPAKDTRSWDPVPAGSLDVLRLVEWNIGQLHFESGSANRLESQYGFFHQVAIMASSG